MQWRYGLVLQFGHIGRRGVRVRVQQTGCGSIAQFRFMFRCRGRWARAGHVLITTAPCRCLPHGTLSFPQLTIRATFHRIYWRMTWILVGIRCVRLVHAKRSASNLPGSAMFRNLRLKRSGERWLDQRTPEAE